MIDEIENCDKFDNLENNNINVVEDSKGCSKNFPLRCFNLGKDLDVTHPTYNLFKILAGIA